MKAQDVQGVLGGRLVGNAEACFTGVSVDSRTLRPGELFVALKGDNTDGHRFLDAALQSGATMALVSEPLDTVGEDRAALVVPDTLQALGSLAKWYRQQHTAKVVAVTGSVGKTTTKEILAACLEGTYEVLASQGNYNTEIGVPLTLFKLSPSTGAVVIEMAMRGPGQISYLGNIALQETSVITNIGPSHIEILGSLERIASAKAEVLEQARVAVLNRDDAWVRKIARDFQGTILWYGRGAKAGYRATGISLEHGMARFHIHTPEGDGTVSLSLPGKHNVYNALAAVAASIFLGAPFHEVLERLQGFRPPYMRLEVMENQGIRIINDAYNSSPSSARSALETLKHMEGRRVAVLGDMLELGRYTRRGHYQVGKAAANSGLGLLVVVGDLGSLIGEASLKEGMEPERVVFCRDNKEAIDYLKGYLNDGDVALVKASRRLQMEEIVQALAGGGRR